MYIGLFNNSALQGYFVFLVGINPCYIQDQLEILLYRILGEQDLAPRQELRPGHLLIGRPNIDRVE